MSDSATEQRGCGWALLHYYPWLGAKFCCCFFPLIAGTPPVLFGLIKKRSYSDLKFCLKHHPQGINKLNPLVNMTALHFAVSLRRSSMAELLIRHGANASATTRSGLTALHVASIVNLRKIATLLVEQANVSVDARDDSLRTPMWYAAYNNRSRIIRMLADHGADVNASDFMGATSLYASSQEGHMNATLTLLQLNANVNAELTGSYTSSPLIAAVYNNHTEVAMSLLEKNANFSERQSYDPLSLAIKNDNLPLMLNLWQLRGANVSKLSNHMTVAAYASSFRIMTYFARDADKQISAKVAWKSVLCDTAKNQCLEGLKAILEYQMVDRQQVALDAALYCSSKGITNGMPK